MTNYLLLYYGRPLPGGESERREIMASWDQWMREVSNALIDAGGPATRSRSIHDRNDTAVAGAPVTGYSLIEAESMDEAVELSKGAPILAEGGRVDVYAIQDVA